MTNIKEDIFLKKGDELAKCLHDQATGFQKFAVEKGYYSQWQKNQRFYENNHFNHEKTADIIDTGAVGELKAISFNHFRNIIRHMLNQITAIMPAFDVSAANTDVASRRAANIGKDVINYYYKIKRATKQTKKAAEQALVYGDGFPVVEWNPTEGREVAVDETDTLEREGDFDIDSISPYDFFYDYNCEDKSKWDWFQFRRKKNKFDLAKIFPKKAEQILALKSCFEDELYYNRNRSAAEYDLDSPLVYVYSCYRKESNSVPNGKYAMYCGVGDAVFLLYEGINIYGTELNCFPLSPGDYLETPFGFTEANLLRAPQELYNMVLSSMTTNAASAGANNIWSPTGSNLKMTTLVDGMNHLQTDSDKKPEVISFYREAPGLANLLGLCNNAMETLSGQNAVVRGNVENTQLKSGVALATVINMAQQYSQALEKTYIEMFEDMSTFILKTLQKVATTERLIDITGKMQKTSVTSFKGEDLNGISRVIVDQTNPITKQPAGKIEIAMELLKIGQISPEQFFDVMNTGNLDVATESDERLLDFIASVKEQLLDGKMIPPIPGINHQLFIKEIHSLIYDVEIVNNHEHQQLMQNILQVVNQQLDLLRQGDEVANLIYGGKQPTPQKVASGEVNTPGPLTGVQPTETASSPAQPAMAPPL